MGARPGVLRHEAERDARDRQHPDSSGEPLPSLDRIAAAPDAVQQHIERRHRDRRDQLADAQRRRVAGKPGRAQRHGPGNEVERVAASQRHGHRTVEQELSAPCAAPDHDNAQRDDRRQVHDVKEGFKNGLHGINLPCV